ncbi:intein-containing Rv2578c family radical SAM protein [Pseudonocardia dioxanivorans]|uniref:intein-containing Rv2578c family radical SAM protein n=1 Tax=Pseudonocardia dioxanivorans TaxID=240495 RepID=UPI0018F8A37D|nr:intein-containing Rv2578c family radical SAM protein [Pseudonocardia dioxanivorans]
MCSNPGVRWSGQQVRDDGVGGDAALPGLRGLLRSVRTPEFAGTVFHEVEAKSVLNRVPAPSRMPFAWTVNPYRGCSHACVYCLDGSTRVLLADGRWRPIADVTVGDAVVGTEVGPDGVRRYVRTRVLAHWSTVRPARRVVLSDGSDLVTSGEHRFLTSEGWRHVSPGWCRSGRRPHLRPGSRLLGPGAPTPSPASEPAYRVGYLCGITRADAVHPAASGEAFPSGRIPLEALARVHRMLADADGAAAGPAARDLVAHLDADVLGRMAEVGVAVGAGAGAGAVAGAGAGGAEPGAAGGPARATVPVTTVPASAAAGSSPAALARGGGWARAVAMPGVWTSASGPTRTTRPEARRPRPGGRASRRAGAASLPAAATASSGSAGPVGSTGSTGSTDSAGRAVPVGSVQPSGSLAVAEALGAPVGSVAAATPVATAARRVPLPAGGGVRVGSAAAVGPAGWPLRPGREWKAGFVAGVLDALGSRSGAALEVRAVGAAGGNLLDRFVAAGRELGLRFVRHAPDPGAGEALHTAVLPADARTLTRLAGCVDPSATGIREPGGSVVAAAGPEVVAVEPLPESRPMFDITTGTGDFVAEGVISHNCFARNTHTYLDLDAGADFDSQIIVKVNAARVLEREVNRPRWRREPVAMGTNTDPYQRAEGRYRLMPGIVRALAGSGTPFSVLTKGTVLGRDLPMIASAAQDVPVGLGVSIALLDRSLQARLEPGAPSPRARLDLVRRITDAGLPCGVMVAPVLPLLTDSAEALDALLGRIAAAGATGASVMALHLRPGTREWFLAWLQREHPGLVDAYGRLYRRGAYVDGAYRTALAERVAPLLRRHGLDGSVTAMRFRGRAAEVDLGAAGRADPGTRPTSDRDPEVAAAARPSAGRDDRSGAAGDQLSLL